MDATLTICDAPTDAIRDAILAPLSAFNAEQGYPADPKPIAITLTDDDGAVVGGLWGKTVYDWLFVDYLVVPAAMRDQDLGAKLMETAERIAIERGCVGSWLTTFTFQARGFYEKLGYQVFGALDHSPRDNVRYFLRKRLDA
ncbi:GNAT family N-acetyltransferase [Sphingomonas sp. AR_OL41]|uniref:GNAT family N-acetyltransferase n=1 Tax=Sphingomonas sp. AR_OL41 TaxID=3042729 RepID=UPI00247FBD2D|nr:GNAT family N-acetyltransferase [Sphingomonas sp. AR_OL41]MDH7976035.1 GNAT family N-acetyltransferase [Sphingomonas sp. AR_OL41]